MSRETCVICKKRKVDVKVRYVPPNILIEYNEEIDSPPNGKDHWFCDECYNVKILKKLE